VPPPRAPPAPGVTLPGSLFSRSYEVNLPSSLTEDHPFALAVFCQPTCVGLRYGRCTPSPQSFSRRCGFTRSDRSRVLAPPLTLRPWFRHGHATSRNPPCPLGRPRHPSGALCELKRSCSGAGMWTCAPSPTPRGLGLGPTNPERIILPQEPLGLRRHRFSR